MRLQHFPGNEEDIEKLRQLSSLLGIHLPGVAIEHPLPDDYQLNGLNSRAIAEGAFKTAPSACHLPDSFLAGSTRGTKLATRNPRPEH